MNTLKVILVAFIVTLTASIAFADEKFFQEENLRLIGQEKRHTYTSVFGDVYRIDGSVSNSLLTACKIMYSPFGGPATVELISLGGSQTLYRIFEEGKTPTSSHRIIQC